MHFISIKENFYPLGILAAAIVILIYKKRGLIFLLIGGVMVGLNDFICHNILKELFARTRPCHVLPDLSYITNCSNSFAFPSNHASNMFTAAGFVSLCCRDMLLVAYSFAFLVGYSRVYLGAHYPSDVLGGAIFGTLMGYLAYRLYKKVLNRVEVMG